MTNSRRLVYEFTIILLATEPLVWRRIQVVDGNLDQLHKHIQNAMGWGDVHLHEFAIEGQQYRNPAINDEVLNDALSTRSATIARLLVGKPLGYRFAYEYDFGDSWQHEIRYEYSYPANPDALSALHRRCRRLSTRKYRRGGRVPGVSSSDSRSAALSTSRYTTLGGAVPPT